MKEALQKLSREVGFDVIGFCTPDIEPSVLQAYHDWVAQGMNAGMDYMARNAEIRADLNKLLPGVKSVIVIALSYLNDRTPVVPQKGEGIIARYAQSRDYHKILKKKLAVFSKKAQNQLGHGVIACDTKPLLEKYFAWKAGVGFVGKNSLVITWKYGSFVLLGMLLTTAVIPPDDPDPRSCGTCTKCIDACPTKAIVKDRVIDARKCIAYWTIEHKGPFTKQTPPLHNRLFGCDICQEVCPWNLKALTATEEELKHAKVPVQFNLQKMARMPKEVFVKTFAGTPIMRAGHVGMKRNAKQLIEEQIRKAL